MWTMTIAYTNTALRRSGMADISGATAIEYAFIGTGIANVIIGAMFAIGDEMAEMIQTTFEASIE